MERPSHMVFDTNTHTRRLPMMGLALGLQAAGLWLFTYGLMSGLIPIAHGPIKLVLTPDKKIVDRDIPPEPHLKLPTKLTAQPPKFKTGRDTGEPGPLTGDGPTPIVLLDHPPAQLDRPLMGIVSTHTVPPYPPIARRIGAEGKVVLRLTVSVEGRVTQADIVTSSGRPDMDEAAQQWILAHWRYKPALSDGTAALSHTLASVTFSLVNEH